MEEIAKLTINPDKVNKEPDLIGEIDVQATKYRVALWKDPKHEARFTGSLEEPLKPGERFDNNPPAHFKLKPLLKFRPAKGEEPTEDDPQFASRLPFPLDGTELYSFLFIQEVDGELNVLFELNSKPRGQGDSDRALIFRESLRDLAVKKSGTAEEPF